MGRFVCQKRGVFLIQSSSIEPSVIVVGGGLAGLTAACYLGRAGRKVTVFEKASSLGGRGTSSNHEGYSFNHGIHAVYTGGAMSGVLGELGIPYTGGTPKIAYVLHEGRLFRAPTSPLSLLTSRLFTFGDKIELVRLLRTIARANLEDTANVSVQQWLKSHIRRPRVLAFMTANARTFVYSSALDLVSADVFVLKMQLSLDHPIVYVDGGWQTIVDGLRKAAEDTGARILTGTPVEAIEEKDGQACGVRLQGGETVAASAIILAVSPREAVKLLPGGDASSIRKFIEGLTPARLACLDVALSRLPNLKYGVVQDLDSPRFMSTQSLYSRVAPEGAALIYTFKQLDPNQPTDPHQNERELEEFLDVTQAGWRDVLVERRFLPRIEAIGMLPAAATSGYRGRPDPQELDLRNLYLAGDWVGSGFLSDASFGSAREAARLILKGERAK
jgi:phytoene dehydrogenase-like protein